MIGAATVVRFRTYAARLVFRQKSAKGCVSFRLECALIGSRITRTNDLRTSPLPHQGRILTTYLQAFEAYALPAIPRHAALLGFWRCVGR